ncbi:metal ABC transporter substrate-binding protein [Adonisia turfae]|uniref:Metal ABC transporter substrate-binding protein n=1 Tax=Adonisia turfae CCMR0081 TaxID=2292702 RepID=A0A6M0RKQ8_9CYAN|nr:metal ABC transporter substrate-binding protein [Adonisia turfae]NEZ56373.1 metal ABC transporter substrate-binding protein [Adonisia turfae CCMR0081]
MLSNHQVLSSNKRGSGLLRISKLGWIASVSMLVGLVGCAQPATQNDTAASGDNTTTAVNLPQVVATTSVLCDLTQQIAQDTVALTCLMEPGQDPHTYAAAPSDRKAIDEADLVLYDGYGFAPQLIAMVEASTNTAPKVAVYEQAVPNPLLADPHDHDHGHGKEDHGEETHADHGEENHDHEAHADHGEENHGHETHAEGTDKEELVADPHIWHNALNTSNITEVIADQLQQINPDQADLYGQNAALLTTQFAELHTWIEAQVTTIPASNRKLVTTHEAFNYFADAYGLELEAALSGINTETSPSASRVADLVDDVKTLGVPAIFAETTSNTQLIETLAKNANVKVAPNPLFVEGPGGPGTRAETMQAMLVSNTCTVVNALGGTCVEADAPL